MQAKLTSRKFWVAVISIIVGVLGFLGADDNAIQFVSGAGLILIPGIIYIITEGRIDAAALQKIDIEELLETIKDYLGIEDSDGDEAAEQQEVEDGDSQSV